MVTIVEKPFTYARPGNNCEPATEVLCPRKILNRKIAEAPNISLSTSLETLGEAYEPFCCYGYCIALLQELSKNLSFVYTLHLVADNQYGSFEKVIRMTKESATGRRGKERLL